MLSVKKVLAVVLVCLFAFSVMQIAVSAQEEATVVVTEAEAVETVQENNLQEDIAAAEQASENADTELVRAASAGTVIGTVLGAIVFAPALLIDLIVWVLSGFNVHIFYSHLFG